MKLLILVIATTFSVIQALVVSVARENTAIALKAAKSKSIPFMAEPKNLAGMVGDKGFDPLGFTDSIDPRFLREAELKHGRIAMLGAVGFVASEFFKLPGEIHNVSPVAAHNVAVASGAMTQILVFVSAIEAISVVALVQMFEGSGRAPGDFSLRLFGYDKANDKTKADLQLKEIENGRLAVS